MNAHKQIPTQNIVFVGKSDFLMIHEEYIGDWKSFHNAATQN